jgi:uncharacterized protein (TIGR03437 family)
MTNKLAFVSAVLVVLACQGNLARAQAVIGIGLSSTPLNFCVASNMLAPPAQTLTVTSGGAAPEQFEASVSQSWVKLQIGSDPPSSRVTFTTPAIIKVQADGTGLPDGSYGDQLQLAFIRGGFTSVPIGMGVNTSFSVDQNPLIFTAAPGSSTAQTWPLQLTACGSTRSFTATATSAGNWLSVAAGSGTPGLTATGATAYASIQVSPTGLANGTYNGTVIIGPSGQPASGQQSATARVILIVGDNTLSANPSSLTFFYHPGDTSLPSQTVFITSTGPPTPFTATSLTTGCGNVFNAVGGQGNPVEAIAGTTPGSFKVQVNTSNLLDLPIGSACHGYLVVNSIGSPIVFVPIILVVSEPGTPIISPVVNAATGLPGPISPGEIISLYGSDLGPATPAGLTLDSSGKVATNTGGVTVDFVTGTSTTGLRLVAAPLTYVSSTQINAVVPYEVAGLSTTEAFLLYNGWVSNSISLKVTDTSPGIFTVGGTAAAALNQDGTVNSVTNPAAPGSVVTFFATGEGQVIPAGITGSVTGANPPQPVEPVDVKFLLQAPDGSTNPMSVNLLYTGESPSLTSGVLQVNAVVPVSAPRGLFLVVLTVGSNSSPSVVTVQVQ